jgi:hypothetical protein
VAVLNRALAMAFIWLHLDSSRLFLCTVAICGRKPAKQYHRGQKSPEEEGRSGPKHLILHQGGGAGTVHPRVLHQLQIRLEGIWNYIGCRILRTSNMLYMATPIYSTTLHTLHGVLDLVKPCRAAWPMPLPIGRPPYCIELQILISDSPPTSPLPP